MKLSKRSEIIEFPKEKITEPIQQDTPANITPLKPETPLTKTLSILKSLINKVQNNEISEEDFASQAGYLIAEMQVSLFKEEENL
jgi:hypothetical protein